MNLTKSYKAEFYNLKINHKIKQTEIKFTINRQFLSTENLPLTENILKETLPSIFRSVCFNNGELPFNIEVKNTETAHLFEHILLEYLCMYKLKKGYKCVKFCGETCWNWKIDEVGVFHIVVSSTLEEKEIFCKALEKSMGLFNFILQGRRWSIDPILIPSQTYTTVGICL